MMSKRTPPKYSSKKIYSKPTKRIKVGEETEIGISSESEDYKPISSPTNFDVNQERLLDKFNLSKLKAILKKPKKNITAYAFFIKEVSHIKYT